jgi:hypothetical protein
MIQKDFFQQRNFFSSLVQEGVYGLAKDVDMETGMGNYTI